MGSEWKQASRSGRSCRGLTFTGSEFQSFDQWLKVLSRIFCHEIRSLSRLSSLTVVIRVQMVKAYSQPFMASTPSNNRSSSNWSQERASWPGACVWPVPSPPSIPLLCLAISAVQCQCFHFLSVYINLKLLTQLCYRMSQTMQEAINK